jgi:TctA family transporter
MANFNGRSGGLNGGAVDRGTFNLRWFMTGILIELIGILCVIGAMLGYFRDIQFFQGIELPLAIVGVGLGIAGMLISLKQLRKQRPHSVVEKRTR